MKFTNGHWLLKKGVSQYPCAHVQEFERKNDSVIFYIHSYKIYNRGQTLGGPQFSLRFSAPTNNALSIEFKHFESSNKGPKFDLNLENLPLEICDESEKTLVSVGELTAIIHKDPFKLEYFFSGRLICGSEPRSLAYLTTDDETYMRERLSADVGEYFYGLGERFTNFTKNGQSVDIWNEDGGTATQQAYKNIPFYVSNKGYGVFVNHPEEVNFEVCSELVNAVQFSVFGENLNYMIFEGANLKEVLKGYTSVTGRPALPPAWSFGLWLSTSFTTDYSEETVNSFIDGMRDIPLSVFHFDCFWMKEYQWCNFEWDARVFPDPKGMLERLHEKNLKICVWINPYVGQRSPLFVEGAREGYFIKNKDGGVWQWDLWQPGLAIVDFTNPNAVRWYQEHLRELLDMGVDAFKTDFGERIPVDGVYFDGSDPKKAHNYYSFLFNKIVFEVLEEKKGKDGAVVFARSATAGSQRFPAHWGGDCDSNYVAMAQSLRGGLSLALCGFGFWSHDIGGFENTATADVYKRWVAFGLTSSHSRLHGSSSYRVPWLFDDEAVEVLKFFAKLKCSLMPYIFAHAVEAHKNGTPLLRPMILEFQDDPVCAHLDAQYMLGSSLLCAPVFNSKGETRVYLPPGIWTQWFTGKVVDASEGGSFVKETHDYFSMGLWVRENSVIATGSDKRADYDYEQNLVLKVFQLYEPITANIYRKNGKKAFSVSFSLDKSEIVAKIKGEHNGFEILLDSGKSFKVKPNEKFIKLEV